VFKNDLQHRVMDFKNIEGRNGIRKIISFNLVDPDFKILSTKDIQSCWEWRRDLI